MTVQLADVRSLPIPRDYLSKFARSGPYVAHSVGWPGHSDLLPRRSFHARWSTAAMLLRRGFFVVLVPLDVYGSRSLLARGWHGPPTHLCRLVCHSVP